MMTVFQKIFLKRLTSTLVFIFNTTNLAGALVTLFGTSVGAAFLTWLFRFNEYVIPLVTFALGILIATVIIFIIYLKAAPVKWLLRGYRWVRAEYLYSIHDEQLTHHSQAITILVEALRTGVDHFENRYQWSGKGKEENPKILNHGQFLVGPPSRRSGWNYYFVHFGHELTPGERVETKILQELYDNDHLFETHLGKIVIEPLDQLVLRVKLHNKLTPTDINFVEYSGPFPSQAIINKKAASRDLGNEIRWYIPSPVFGHLYVIEWSWGQ